MITGNKPPTQRQHWYRRLPEIVFLVAASYFFLRSHVYFAPKTVDMSALALHSIIGTPVPPVALQGKAVVLNFWAPWCPPCRLEMPWLQQLQQEHPNVAVVGVEDDPEQYEQAKALADQQQVSYMLVRSNAAVQSRFGHVAGLPTTLYISPSGRVVHTVTDVVPEIVMRRYLQDATSTR